MYSKERYDLLLLPIEQDGMGAGPFCQVIVDSLENEENVYHQQRKIGKRKNEIIVVGEKEYVQSKTWGFINLMFCSQKAPAIQVYKYSPLCSSLSSPHLSC